MAVEEPGAPRAGHGTQREGLLRATEADAAFQRQDGDDSGNQEGHLKVAVLSVPALACKSYRVGHQERRRNEKDHRGVHEGVSSRSEEARAEHAGTVSTGCSWISEAFGVSFPSMVYRWCMARTNLDIDDGACAEIMRRYRLKTKREAVNLALRALAAEPLSLDEARRMRGSGWTGDLEEMRATRSS